MVVLSETPPEDFTPEKVVGGLPVAGAEVRDADRLERAVRVAPSVHACRAVVAMRLRWPEQRGGDAAPPAGAQLRRRAARRLRHARAGRRAGRAAGRGARRWADAPEVEAAMRADMAASRSPSPASRAQDYKLGGPEEERRYTCPSYELIRATAGAGRLADRRARRPAGLPPGRGLRGGDRQPRARAHPPARSAVGRRGARVGRRPARDGRGRGRDATATSPTCAASWRASPRFEPVGVDGYWSHPVFRFMR